MKVLNVCLLVVASASFLLATANLKTTGRHCTYTRQDARPANQSTIHTRNMEILV
ncbi:GD15682 [Drosophila simulans]|uniref:GD15682 n=1 Tax=Drosophila simulans TaxID=7240 RepID=B4R6F5_DROSI|nr:GD15682 [Drosophila simulans]